MPLKSPHVLVAHQADRQPHLIALSDVQTVLADHTPNLKATIIFQSRL